MKKIKLIKNFTFFFICFLVSVTSFAQPTFQKSYGTKADEVPNSFIQTNDKGFAMFGTTGDSLAYWYLVKADSLGNKLWSKEYDILNAGGFGGRLIQAKDKGYVICSGNVLLKTDSLGNIKWTKNLGYSFDKIMEVSGGYVLAGSDVNANAMFMKTDLSGTVLWTSNSINNSGDAILDVTQLEYDSCFYLISKNRIIKMDKNGNHIWSKYIYVNGSIGFSSGSQMNSDPDGKSIDCFLVEGDLNYWFVIDTSGAVKRVLSVPEPPGYANSAFYTSSHKNGLLFTYSVYSPIVGNTYNYHIFLFKADSAGNIKWSTRLGGQKQDYPASILQTTDGGVAIFGATQNFTAGEDDFYLIKIDSMGNSACNQDTFHVNKLTSVTVSLQNDNIFNIIPNPLDSAITVTTNTIQDTNFNACLCYPPHASFYYSQYSGYMFDSSRWATNWYWSFGDGTFDSTTISPKHQYADTGTYTVCLTVKNACGKDSVCKQIDYQIPTVSISTITDNNKTSIYPNPFTTTSTILFSEAGKHYLELDDITGRKLSTIECTNTQYQLNRNGLAQGIYLLRVFDSQMKYEASLKLVVE